MSNNGGIFYAIIVEHDEKLYVWYRNFEEHLEVLEDRALESKIKAVISEPSGILELLDAHIADWMAAHRVETIGGFTKPKDPPIIPDADRIRQLEISVYALANRLKYMTKERNALALLSREKNDAEKENALIAASTLMLRVLPLETVVAHATAHGGCKHIAEACDSLGDVVGKDFKRFITTIAEN